MYFENKGSLGNSGLPWWQSGKESICNTRGMGLRRSPGEGNGNPLQYFCLGNPMDRGAWWTTVHGVTSVAHDLATKPHILHDLNVVSMIRVSLEGTSLGWPGQAVRRVC